MSNKIIKDKKREEEYDKRLRESKNSVILLKHRDKCLKKEEKVKIRL